MQASLPQLQGEYALPLLVMIGDPFEARVTESRAEVTEITWSGAAAGHR